VTTFGTTTLDDQATVGGSHTSAEAVGTLALENTGLKSSFHGKILLNGRDKGRRF